MTQRNVFAAIAVCAAAALALAQNQPPKPQPGEKISTADRDFVQRPAQDNLLEIRLGEVAKQKATSDSVKQIADHMVADHTKLGQELQNLATSLNITLPKELDKQHKDTVERLQKLSGSEFDREYLDFMNRDHQQDIQEFQRFVKDGQNADLKSFAQRTIPALEKHLNMVRDARQMREGHQGHQTGGTQGQGGSSPSGAPPAGGSPQRGR